MKCAGGFSLLFPAVCAFQTSPSFGVSSGGRQASRTPVPMHAATDEWVALPVNPSAGDLSRMVSFSPSDLEDLQLVENILQEEQVKKACVLVIPSWRHHLVQYDCLSACLEALKIPTAVQPLPDGLWAFLLRRLQVHSLRKAARKGVLEDLIVHALLRPFDYLDLALRKHADQNRASMQRRCRSGMGLLVILIMMALNLVLMEGTDRNIIVGSSDLSDDALASIADLNDHPVEDNDAARADRMLAALESIPEHERQGFGMDVELLRSKPLEERLVKLEQLWAVRQQELREAYDAMPKVNELLTKRIEVLQDASATEDAVIVALADLEDMLSDIDMARDFHTIGGLPTLASKLRDPQPESVREMAAWVIGTAVKNEPEHQLWVLEDGQDSQPSALALLLENAKTAETSTLMSKIVYALSACLRNNGDVQLQFGSLRGEIVLSAMYDAVGSDSRVKTKTLTLMSDLLQEAASGSPAAVLATMPVGSNPSSGGVWCRRVDEALQHAPSPSALEKAIEAVESFIPSCRLQFAELETKQRLEGLAQQCRTSPPAGLEEVGAEFRLELTQKLAECALALR
eukprot:g14781.t2